MNQQVIVLAGAAAANGSRRRLSQAVRRFALSSEATRLRMKRIGSHLKRAARVSRHAIGILIVAAGATILISNVSELAKAARAFKQLSLAVQPHK